MAFEDVEDHRSSGFDSHEGWCLVQNSDSSAHLYGELQNTAETVKKLADKLQKIASRKDLTNEKGVQTNGCCEETRTELMKTRTELMECIAENLRLRQSLKDVSDINHRWQNYNYERQKHVQHLLSTMSELRRTIDTMKQQSRESSSIPSKESDKNEAHDQLPLELQWKANTTKQQHRKSAVQLKESDTNEPNNQCASQNNKLLQEVRVLSRQLKDARNESKELKQRLEKVEEENDTLKVLLKTYRSEWEDENRKKVEALGQAQKVVQELCALKVNCQMQAETLMKISTVSFNCSLCKGSQSIQNLNNLSIDSQSECNVKAQDKERHKHLTQTAPAIIQSVNGIEVHLHERCSGDTTNQKKKKIDSLEMTSEEKLYNSTNPIVTFPDSDSDDHTITTEESCVQLVTSSLHLTCPICTTSFPKQHGSQFLDHYTKCKLSLGKAVS